MRLFLNLVLTWALASLVLGYLGHAWLQSTWREGQAGDFRRTALATLAAVEAMDWPQPAEASDAWLELERNLDLAMMPISVGQGGDLPSARKEPAAGEVAWDRAGTSGGHRISIQLALRSPSIGVGSNQLLISRQLEPSAIAVVWWTYCGLLSAVTYSLGLIGWWVLRRESSAKRKLLKPWFEALESPAGGDQLLPAVDPQDADLSIQLDALARGVNENYAQLKNANDRAELVLGNLREGVLAIDDRFRILLANKALHRLLDLPVERYLLRPLLELIRTPAITSLVEKVVRDQISAEEQIEFGTGPKHLRILARPLPLGNGRSGALITVRDETLIKRVDMIKRDFVANASHELKTPLAAIRAYAETLQMGALDDREMSENFVGNIIAQADRMDGLVQGMLQLSRVEVGSAIKFRRFNAVEAIESCIAAAEAVARSKGVRILVETPEEQIEIQSDRDGFQTIASNLLSNGVRYTQSQGSVTVALRETANSIMLEVSDTGIGMSDEDLERIFERFYRAEKDRASDSGGTGLGLSIVKHLTQALGGSVRATSQLGEGSTFLVELPKVPASADSTPQNDRGIPHADANSA